MIDKTKRWENKQYIRWVSSLPCSNCSIEDDTIVAHHLKGRYAPLSGGGGYKASDWLTMPMCYTCHCEAHSGNVDVLDWQPMFILKTLDKAFRDGIMVYRKHLLFGEDLND